MIKKIISLIPYSFASRIYHLSEKLPFTKRILVSLIKLCIPRQIILDEGILLLDTSDIAVSGALTFGMFEPLQTRILRESIVSGMNIIDIGAHIGYYSVIFSKRVGDRGKVFAFEPEKRNFESLKQNIKLNDLKNVIILNKALSDNKGNRDLFIDEYNRAHHSFAQTDFVQKGQKISTTTLDEFLEAQDNPVINVIKMDIEGAEPIALRGMERTLTRNRDVVLFTEVYPAAMGRLGESAADFLEKLQNLQFSLYVINEDSKQIIPILDIKKFIQNFPKGESFVNIKAVR